MKNVKLSLALIGLILAGLTSCERRDEGFGIGAEVTEAEAIELVQETLISEVYGINMQAYDASEIVTENASKSAFECGVTNTRTRERNSENGAVINYSHSIDYNFTLLCENNAATAYTIDYSGSGVYSSPRMTSNDVITYTSVLDNIIEANTPFVYNSSFTREGTQTIRINGNNKDFESTLTIKTTNIEVDKVTRRILSGSATFSLTGILTSGESFGYSGDITFNGNGGASIEINNNMYNVSL